MSAELKALEMLRQAKMSESDAVTCLDTLIARLVDDAASKLAGLTMADRHERIVSLVGSDAVRAFVMLEGEMV